MTDTIQNLVPTMKTLKFCIRALKLWAKRRGVPPSYPHYPHPIRDRFWSDAISGVRVKW